MKGKNVIRKGRPRRERPSKRAVSKEAKRPSARRTRRAPPRKVKRVAQVPKKPSIELAIKRPPPPVPKVVARWSHGSKERYGKGFSRGELLGVKLSFLDARRLGLPVDYRRSSIYPDNVRMLDEWLKAR